jgi:hypothetical protein
MSAQDWSLDYRMRLTRLALEQLLAQLDCGPTGVPNSSWLENYEVRIKLGDNSTATQDKAIACLREMLDDSEGGTSS